MSIVGSQPLRKGTPVNKSGVATPSTPYMNMKAKWDLPEALRGGTEEMRERGREYLPQEPKESNEAYAVRLKRTFLYNLYWRSVTTIAGLAFIKPVVVNGVPDELKYLEFDFDGTGRSLTEVAYDMTIDAIHYGKTHLLADFPVVDSESMNLADFRRKGYKPYVTLVNPTKLIGWHLESDVGRPRLENIRIMEEKTVPSIDDKWSDKIIRRIRVIHGEHSEVHINDPELTVGYEKESGVIKNSLGYIPLMTAYSNKKGFLEAEPSMYDLAMLNLRHWQSSSDQNNILHIARVPFLLAKGFEEGSLTNMEIGTNRMVVTDRYEADIKYVEHTGKAIDSGRLDLQDVENQMAVLGADFLMSKGVSRMTATARKIDRGESMSTLQLALRSIEQAIEQAYITAGRYLGVDASEVSVSIGDDLSVANEPNPTNALVTLLDSGLLTDEQAVEEAKRQGILSSYFDLSEDRPRNQEPLDPPEEVVSEETVIENEDDDEQDEENNQS